MYSNAHAIMCAAVRRLNPPPVEKNVSSLCRRIGHSDNNYNNTRSAQSMWFYKLY